MIERSKIKEENMKKTNKFAIVVSVAVLVLTVLWLFIHQSFVSGFTGILWILGWGILVVSIIISFVISCACREKRAVWIDACCVLFILVSCIFLHQTPEPSETEIWERRETVVAEILSGELQADEMGTIELPDAEQYHDISDSDRVVLLSDDGKRGIYFYTFSGLLESSRGYIYITDDLPEESCNIYYDIVNLEHYEGNWYSCSTD